MLTHFISVTLLIDSEELWGEILYHLFLLMFFHLPGITQFIKDFWEVHCPALLALLGEGKDELEAQLPLCPCCTESLRLQKARRTCPQRFLKLLLSVCSYRGHKPWNLFQWVCPVEAFLLVFFWRLIGLQRKTSGTALFFSLSLFFPFLKTR